MKHGCTKCGYASGQCEARRECDDPNCVQRGHPGVVALQPGHDCPVCQIRRAQTSADNN